MILQPKEFAKIWNSASCYDEVLDQIPGKRRRNHLSEYAHYHRRRAVRTLNIKLFKGGNIKKVPTFKQTPFKDPISRLKELARLLG